MALAQEKLLYPNKITADEISPWANSASRQLQHLFDASQSIEAMRGRGFRFDSQSSLMLAQQLTVIETRIYEAVYPALKARKAIATGDEAIQPGARFYIWNRTEYHGNAAVIANGSTDIPRVSAKVAPTQWSVDTIADQFNYSIDDLAAAALSGVPVDITLQMAARKAIETKLDDLALFGQTTLNKTGFANDAACTSAAIAATSDWTVSGTTAQVIFDDAVRLINGVQNASAEVFNCNAVLFSLDAWTNGLTRTHAFGGKPILEMLRDAFPEVSFDKCSKLDTAASGSKPLAIAYQKTPDVASLAIPEEFNMLPPNPNGMGFDVVCRLKTLGCMVKQPLGMVYMTGTGG